jgi:hypothetical protein
VAHRLVTLAIENVGGIGLVQAPLVLHSVGTTEIDLRGS